jgi:hypothetical protein
MLMTREEIYDAWAPAESEWSQWVKPVLFAHLPDTAGPVGATPVEEGLLTGLPRSGGETALVLDLPKGLGAQMANALAQQRYRPVPLYNSCPPPKLSAYPAAETDPSDILSPTNTIVRAAVEVQPILDAIVANAAPLRTARLPAQAPPAFLMDSNRRIGQAGFVAVPGAFDNRSVSLPTDFPSANFLLSRGIRRIVLAQLKSIEPEADLAHTLLRWQQAGIAIDAIALAAETGPRRPQPVTVRRPPLFRIAWYGLLARMGLRPNPLGGFGGLLPDVGRGFG